ncbi:MAG: redoxin domain-containing protein [Minisyncoccota bacterium]
MCGSCEDCEGGCGGCDTASVEIGHQIPDIETQAYHKDEIHTVKLSDYRGTWLVLFFYPGDFTFVCPTELEEMAEHYAEFQKLNTEILSVSVDSVHVHKAWHDTSEAIKKVQFPMLSDLRHELAEMFGAYIPEEGVARRGTFIVDPDGILKGVEINDNSVGRSAKELLRKLKAMQFVREHGGQVCPASWEEGDDTLTPGLDLVGKI